MEFAMSFFRRFFPRLKSRRELELEYLAGAANRYDLENREREIARGKFAGM